MPVRFIGIIELDMIVKFSILEALYRGVEQSGSSSGS